MTKLQEALLLTAIMIAAGFIWIAGTIFTEAYIERKYIESKKWNYYKEYHGWVVFWGIFWTGLFLNRLFGPKRLRRLGRRIKSGNHRFWNYSKKIHDAIYRAGKKAGGE